MFTTLLEIKMALSMICRHFDVLRSEPEKNIEERFIFTMMLQDLMISLRPRENHADQLLVLGDAEYHVTQPAFDACFFPEAPGSSRVAQRSST